MQRLLVARHAPGEAVQYAKGKPCVFAVIRLPIELKDRTDQLCSDVGEGAENERRPTREAAEGRGALTRRREGHRPKNRRRSEGT